MKINNNNNNNNNKMVESLLMKDPETGEELRIISDLKDNGDGSYYFDTIRKDGNVKWRHTIHTEEIL